MENFNNSVYICFGHEPRYVDIIREINGIKKDPILEGEEIDYKSELESRHHIYDLWWDELYAEYAQNWFRNVCQAHPLVGFLINLEKFASHYVECQINQAEVES